MERIKCDLARIRDHFQGANYSTQQIEKIGQSVTTLVEVISGLDPTFDISAFSDEEDIPRKATKSNRKALDRDRAGNMNSKNFFLYLW